MAVSAEVIEQRIREAMPEAVVQITDLRGDGDHYAACVESVHFRGKSRLQQHRMIHQALLGVDLHALALRTAAPRDETSPSGDSQDDGS